MEPGPAGPWLLAYMPSSLSRKAWHGMWPQPVPLTLSHQPLHLGSPILWSQGLAATPRTQLGTHLLAPTAGCQPDELRPTAQTGAQPHNAEAVPPCAASHLGDPSPLCPGLCRCCQGLEATPLSPAHWADPQTHVPGRPPPLPGEPTAGPAPGHWPGPAPVDTG